MLAVAAECGRAHAEIAGSALVETAAGTVAGAVDRSRHRGSLLKFGANELGAVLGGVLARGDADSSFEDALKMKESQARGFGEVRKFGCGFGFFDGAAGA